MANWRIAVRVVDCPEVWPRTCSGGSWGDTRVLSYSGLAGSGKCSHLLGDLGRIEKRGVEGRISWGRKEEARLLLLTPHLLVGILGSVGRHISGSADRECKMTVLLHYSIEPRMRLVNKTTHITATPPSCLKSTTSSQRQNHRPCAHPQQRRDERKTSQNLPFHPPHPPPENGLCQKPSLMPLIIHQVPPSATNMSMTPIRTLESLLK